MSEKKAKNKEIIKKLNSGNDTQYIEALNKLRDVGNITYLSDVFEAYTSSFSIDVKKNLLSFISDIKDKRAIPYIIGFLENIDNDEDLSYFVAGCWQSGLTYEKHIDFFTDMIINKKYQATLEAFTVVENCLHTLSNEDIQFQINKLKDALDRISEDKKLFIVEIINTFQSFLTIN